MVIRWGAPVGLLTSDGLHSTVERMANFDVYVISGDGGVPRRLTTGPSDNVRPSWSRDGRWIYFGSRRNGEYEIWKTPVQGGAAAQVANTKGGHQAFESLDGKWVYYAKENAPGIWKVAVDGGETTRVLEQGVVGGWSLTDQGICFLSNDPDGPMFHFFGFAEQKASLLRKFSKETGIVAIVITYCPRLQTAAGSFIPSLDQLASDLMLVENFR